MKREGYAQGGKWYCKICKKSHHFLSGIGKEHIKYASKGVKHYALLEYGLY